LDQTKDEERKVGKALKKHLRREGIFSQLIFGEISDETSEQKEANEMPEKSKGFIQQFFF